MAPNVLGTMQLLRLAEEKKSESFLLFSTGEVYGKVTGQEEIDETVYGAVDTLDLRNCYCESKRLAEMFCRAWWAEKKVPARIARIAHTYGPTMDIEADTRVFAAFVSDVIHGRDIAMDSDGSSKRPFTYIPDKKISVVRKTARNEKNATVNNIAIRNRKLRELGWNCRYDTKEGFRRTIEAMEEERCC